MTRVPRTRVALMVAAMLAIATLAVYWPIGGHAFLIWDDDGYITDNPHVREGLTLDGLKWAFTTDYAANWHPLTWISHMVDCSVFGVERSGAHHGMNLALHVANVLLMLFVWQRMTGAFWPSAFVAAVFALHPLHVESVAWAAERKDVLSAFFWLLCMGAYASYAQLGGRVRYALVLVFLGLGLMAKPVLVTLPFVFLLLDFWPLRRWSPPRWRTGPPRETPARLLLEKAPMLVLVAASSVVTYVVQRRGRAMDEVLDTSTQILTAVMGYASYLVKTVWPTRLSPMYPHLGAIWPLSQILGAVVLLGGVSALVLALRRRRYLITGWLWYLGTLVPMIGFVQIGGQVMADRYTYLPMTGLAVMVAWGLAETADRWPRSGPVVIALALVAIAACAWRSVKQVAYWRDDVSLFSHAVAVTENNWIMHLYLGNAYTHRKRDREAIPHFQEAARIHPRHVTTFLDLGLAHARLAQYELAAGAFRKAVELAPDRADLRYDLGLALREAGHPEDAVPHLRRATELEPGNADAWTDLGAALLSRGRAGEAVEAFRRALAARPDHARTLNLLGEALLETSLVEAGTDAAREALESFERAAERQPRWWVPHWNAARLLAAHPDASVRNAARAETAARLACELTRNTSPEALDALAAAEAESGRFDQAQATMLQAIVLTEKLRDRARLAEMEARRRRYLSRQPYRLAPHEAGGG